MIRPLKLFDSCVTLFIVLNTAFLAAEHHGMSQELKDVLDMGNKVSEMLLLSIFFWRCLVPLSNICRDFFQL